MISARKLAANRRNALRSSGPRSAAGKARSRANALRHGFAAVALAPAVASAEVLKLTKALAGENSSPQVFQQAVIVAKSRVQLQRMEALRSTLLERIATVSVPSTAEESETAKPGGDLETLNEALKELQRLDRYVIRESARHDRGLRDLIGAQQADCADALSAPTKFRLPEEGGI